ncbi:HalOD1 output domain-containing protein [Haladaptatus sp. DFWS20]|uniref:HalOD1 output domain-containing protein n=1 Tax=Haladaptatus sp. DFWS20 TaxID=3403467 RepID=UPI003EB79CE1
MTSQDDVSESNIGSQNASTIRAPNDTESVTTTIIERIHAHEDISPNDLPPLYEVIDPEALDLLFATKRDGSPRSTPGSVSFQYQDYLVTVTSENDVTIDPHGIEDS